MIAETIPAIQMLSTEDKLLLAAELWREVADLTPEEPNPAIAGMLQARVREYEADPSKVSTWEEVKERMRTSRHGGSRLD